MYNFKEFSSKNLNLIILVQQKRPVKRLNLNNCKKFNNKSNTKRNKAGAKVKQGNILTNNIIHTLKNLNVIIINNLSRSAS